MVTGEGNGPVNALDHALRPWIALTTVYPEIGKAFELIDFKVRILDQMQGTDAITRVLIETTDGTTALGSTVGVGPNLLEAAWEALTDSAISFGLRRHGELPADLSRARAPYAPAQMSGKCQARRAGCSRSVGSGGGTAGDPSGHGGPPGGAGEPAGRRIGGRRRPVRPRGGSGRADRRDLPQCCGGPGPRLPAVPSRSRMSSTACSWVGSDAGRGPASSTIRSRSRPVKGMPSASARLHAARRSRGAGAPGQMDESPASATAQASRS